MRSIELRITSGSRLITDLTHEAASFVAGQADGLLSVFVPYATAGVALIETGAGTEPDLADALERLLPTEDIYRHRHGSLGHGRDHVLPAFVSPSLTIPVLGGRLTLGTWQSIVLVDPNGDNPRRAVRLSFLPG
jgi:secondary thiamine-phosphate synthase enzyme